MQKRRRREVPVQSYSRTGHISQFASMRITTYFQPTTTSNFDLVFQQHASRYGKARYSWAIWWRFRVSERLCACSFFAVADFLKRQRLRFGDYRLPLPLENRSRKFFQILLHSRILCYTSQRTLARWSDRVPKGLQRSKRSAVVNRRAAPRKRG